MSNTCLQPSTGLKMFLSFAPKSLISMYFKHPRGSVALTDVPSAEFGPHRIILQGPSRTELCRHERSTTGEETPALHSAFQNALALLECLQSGTDATRQGDLLEGVKAKHRDAWRGGGSVDLTGSIYHSVKMLAPRQTHTHIHPNMHKEITHTLLSILLSWQEVSNECATLKTLERKQGQLSLLPPTLRGTQRPSHFCVSWDNWVEKLSPDKRALSRAEGRFYVSLSLSDGDVEGRLWGERLFMAITAAGTVTGPFDFTIPTLSASRFLCLYWCAPGTQSWYPAHTVSVLWPHSSDCINSDYGRIILVCLAIKYTHVWLSGQPANLSSAPVPVPSNSTKRLPLSVVVHFYQRGMCLIGLKYVFPLTLPETFSTTAKGWRISFGLCGCSSKSKQDEAVSQSSGVCVTKGCPVNLLFNTHSGLFPWEMKR